MEDIGFYREASGDAPQWKGERIRMQSGEAIGFLIARQSFIYFGEDTILVSQLLSQAEIHRMASIINVEDRRKAAIAFDLSFVHLFDEDIA